MAVVKTFQVGTSIVRKRAKKIVRLNSKSRQIVRDLTDTMRHNNLVGMAAPQIGESVRIFVSEIRKTKFRKNVELEALRVFINPRILKKSSKQAKGYEGCGSIAGAQGAFLFAPVKRAAAVEVTALDAKGKQFKIQASGLLARIIQHEIDHLDGILFIDKVNTREILDREEYLKIQKRK